MSHSIATIDHFDFVCSGLTAEEFTANIILREDERVTEGSGREHVCLPVLQSANAHRVPFPIFLLAQVISAKTPYWSTLVSSCCGYALH